MNYDFKNKAGNINNLNRYMLAKTLSMFEWENLPETIPVKELEQLLQVSGYAFITDVNGELYAFNGGLGGEPDVYGNPTTITISNPSLKFNETLSLIDDGVLIFNDDMKMGLMPLLEKHHTMLIENDINMVLHGYNSRMKTMISASDDKTKSSAELYIKKITSGDIAVIGETALFDGIKLHPHSSSQSSSISSLIEYHQYIKGSLYNELGLSSAFNMKKERLITSEVEQGEDSLFPYVYNMMANRLTGVERINEKYGLAIAVDFGSVWGLKNSKLVDNVISDEPYDEPYDEPSDEPYDEPSDEPSDVMPDEPTDEPSDEPSDESTDIDDLKAIIDDDESSDDDKKTAIELLEELEK